MQLKSIVLLILASFAFLGLAICDSNVEAQELRNALRDFRDERVFNYRPNDPQYRGKAFNIQTKHYGKFYNCDGEEDKRNSPYICWKRHFEKDFPTRVGFCENLRRDIAAINQRLNDGAGPCRQANANCNCTQCQQAAVATPQPNCPCASCAANAETRNQTGPIHSIAKSARSKNAAVKSASVVKPSKRQFAKTTKSNCPTGQCGTAATQTANAPQSIKQAIQNASRDASRSFRPQERSYGLISGKILNSEVESAGESQTKVAELAPIIKTSTADQTTRR